MKKYALTGVAGAVTAILILAFIFYPRDVQQYFFFQDSDFSISPNSDVAKWKSFGWHFSDPFNYRVDFGSRNATVFYNESSGENWGGAVLLQGKQPHSMEIGPRILGGTSIDNAKEVGYVEFSGSKPVEGGKFFLEARVMVAARDYTVFAGNAEAISNVGADLMFGFDDVNYDDSNMTNQVAIHAGILFSRVWWDSTTRTIHHDGNWSGITSDLYTRDIQITLIRGQIPQLNTWYMFRIDLSEIIRTIFDLTHTEKIRFYGIQVYADGISSYTHATFDYIRTSLE